MLKNPALWRALEAFEIGRNDVAFSFRDRLARENGWSRGHADAAILEYKKFLYLTATGETMRTPSPAVDQVWHLHLTYSRSYWDDLCGRVIGRKIHHGPTEGGAAEDAKFFQLYEETLAAYAKEFGAPPADLWPDASRRFRPTRERWVDLDTVYILPRSILLHPSFRAAAAAATAAIALAWSGAVAAASKTERGSDQFVLPMVAGAGGFVLLMALLGVAVAGRKGKAKQPDSGGSCSSYMPVSSCGGGKGGSDGGHGGDGGSGCGGGGCGGS